MKELKGNCVCPPSPPLLPEVFPLNSRGICYQAKGYGKCNIWTKYGKMIQLDLNY